MRRECRTLDKGITLKNWLQSNSNPINKTGPIIDTHIEPYRLETTVIFKEVDVGSLSSVVQLACGCWNDNNNRYYPVMYRGSNTTNYNSAVFCADRHNTEYKLADHNINAIHTVLYNDDDNKTYCDGVYVCTVSDITVQSLPFKIALFGGNNIPKSWRIYYAKFRRKDTNTILGEFFPALDANGVPCMYDTVTQQCFYNIGTGSFTYG